VSDGGVSVTASKWLEGYSGESVDQLIDLASEYRIDSVVVALEQALLERAERFGLACLSEAERTVLAVEALEREVNNGGYHQFFLNAAEHAPEIVAGLERAICPLTAEISQSAIGHLGLRQPFTPEQVHETLEQDLEGRLIDVLSDQCDQRYYNSGEPIEDRLFAYVCANRHAIQLP
jgi:hypothetical protein